MAVRVHEARDDREPPAVDPGRIRRRLVNDSPLQDEDVGAIEPSVGDVYQPLLEHKRHGTSTSRVIEGWNYLP
jgi:hypothetical protein